MTNLHEPRKGLNLRLDDEAGLLIADVQADHAGEAIDELWLNKEIDTCGCGAWQRDTSGVALIIAQYNAGHAIAAIKIAERKDASLAINVSPDGMAALLDIIPAQGGKLVTKAEVLSMLAEKGVTFGHLIEEVNNAIAKGAAAGIVIARGRAPVAGKDASLHRLIPDVRSRVPVVSQSGHTDYRDLGDILVVRPEEPLMRLLPETAGINGMTVMGVPVPAPPGKALRFASRLPGATISENDPNLLLAEISGQPIEVKGGMMVEPVFTVDRVNMASGNIRFDGSVVVRGDVSTGMTIEATGDIEIKGTAEPCRLDAGGNIVVKGGAMGSIGRKDSDNYLIRCGGTFNAGYAQQVRIEAGDSIFIDDTVMQCDMTAANHVRVGNRRRGHIIGGSVLATISITGKVLGSSSRVTTTLAIGVSPEINKRIHALAGERHEKEDTLLDTSKLLAFANSHPGKLQSEVLERARQSAAALSGEIEALRNEELGLNGLVELSTHAKVLAEERLYEGVVVQLGGLKFRVKGEHGAAMIGLGPQGLGMLPRDDGLPPESSAAPMPILDAS